jgi:DNA-directed RNA polymerase subunit RPC12/RpoP
VKKLNKTSSKVSMTELAGTSSSGTPRGEAAAGGGESAPQSSRGQQGTTGTEDDLSVGGVSVESNDLDQQLLLTDRKLSFDLPPPPPVSSWIETYGVDPDYYLRRNRRITMRLFQAMLSIKYTRLLTNKYGIVFVHHYPPVLSMEEELNKVVLRVREDFVNVIVPSCVPRYLNREDILEMFGNVPREGFLHLESINKRASVNLLVTMVQCMIRQHFARKQKYFLLKISEAIAKFQRIFRRRNRLQHHAAYVIQSCFYFARAKVRTKHMRLEKTSAILIQCAYRCWCAKMKEFQLRTVHGIRVLKYTPSLPDHGPKCALDCKSYTMWIVDSPQVAELRVELPIKEAIDAIWIMTSTYEASPKSVTIGVVLEKTKREYVNLYTKIPLPKKRGLRWMKFFFKSKISKYFKITFEGNYGDKSNISVREVRFVRAKEREFPPSSLSPSSALTMSSLPFTSSLLESATILQQPSYVILPTGPRIGDIKRVELSVEAEGWPLPNYQWYKNGSLLTGETRPQIMIPLYCHVSTATRSYRCSSCKNICKHSPKNAYQVICANCGHKFDYKDVSSLPLSSSSPPLPSLLFSSLLVLDRQIL